MRGDQTYGNQCCEQESNVVEVEGSHTCVKCGLVIDMLCMEGNYIADSYLRSDNDGSLIDEYCERGHIDPKTSFFASDTFNLIVKKVS